VHAGVPTQDRAEEVTRPDGSLPLTAEEIDILLDLLDRELPIGGVLYSAKAKLERMLAERTDDFHAACDDEVDDRQAWFNRITAPTRDITK
jgi:hypothetical protein